MMALRPCYRSNIGLSDILAAKQDEQQELESKQAMQDALNRAEEFAKGLDAILNR